MLGNLSTTVVVFDLDDTLYQEADYVDSGVRYVCEQIEALCGHEIYFKIKTALEKNPRLDWLNLACEHSKFPISAKESLLWMYRLHCPKINLSMSCKEALNAIRLKCRAVAILTDGRSVTQRLKLKALGISDLPAYISEDYGELKPSPGRFKAIQADYPAEHYVYIADNLQKDFLGCNPLGWITVGMLADMRSVYTQVFTDYPLSAQPRYWVSSWQDLTKLLFTQKLGSS
jgi:putative hydrolase of the HAD superfamily